MKEAEREIIKLRANYINSLAVVFAAVGVIGPLYSILHQMDQGFSWPKVLVALFVAIGAGLSSLDCHLTARKVLTKLDEN